MLEAPKTLITVLAPLTNIELCKVCGLGGISPALSKYAIIARSIEKQVVAPPSRLRLSGSGRDGWLVWRTEEEEED